jgi:hypothetical protein
MGGGGVGGQQTIEYGLFEKRRIESIQQERLDVLIDTRDDGEADKNEQGSENATEYPSLVRKNSETLHDGSTAECYRYEDARESERVDRGIPYPESERARKYRREYERVCRRTG